MAPGIILNRYSRQITSVKAQGGAQAMLYATGIKDEAQMQLPQVGISSMWWEKGIHVPHSPLIALR